MTDAHAAWRLFTLTWIPVAALALALALGLALTGFSIKPQSAMFPACSALLFAAICYGSVWLSGRYQRVSFVFGSATQLVVITLLITPLTYIAAAASMPLQDANLAALDRMLGLDWRGYVAFVNRSPQLSAFFALGYGMISWPIFFIPVLLAMQRHFGRLQQFTLAFLLTLIATTVISTLVPALGAYHQLGIRPEDYSHFPPLGYLDQLRDFPLVRDGSLRDLDLMRLVGIITFPSFHSAACVLYIWVFWPIWWMRPAAVIVESAMLLATPVGGGHYFVDVFAGIGIAALAIAAARSISERVTRGVAPAMVLPEAAVAAE